MRRQWTLFACLGALAVLAASCTVNIWGLNNFGQVGDGTTTNAASPVPIEQPLWSQVSAGRAHTCGLGNVGSLWCWGDDNFEQQGNGTGATGNVYTPTAVDTATNWNSVATGWGHTCATKSNGELWCWGNNTYAQVGLSGTETRAVPERVEPLETWRTVSAGVYHTCAITTVNELSCWGRNTSGQVGNGATSLFGGTAPYRHTGSDWASVSAGERHTCATKANGTLWCWGSDSLGQMGNGSASSTSILVPTQVGAATDWTQVEAGYDHVCGTRALGDLYCWGRSTAGQVGNGVAGNYVHSVTAIAIGTTWADLSAGAEHTCGLRTAGTVWCWGRDAYGQIGHDSATGSYSTTPTQLDVGAGWVSIELGEHHSCALKNNDRMWCWGETVGGRAGLGEMADAQRAEPVNPVWTDIAAGASHSCRRGESGSVWCWGGNSDGQLGSGDTTDRAAPDRVFVQWDERYDEIDARGNNTCAVRDNSDLYCWGDNSQGQIGDGTTTDRPTKTLVLASVAQVSTGSHTCAVRLDGTLWCWGWNNTGQVGDGTTTSRSSPTQIGVATNWASVSTGSQHTCGLTVGGTLSCWGNGSNGEIGNSSTADQLTPTPVNGATSWTSVAAGNGHTCATVNDLDVLCWGLNVYGEVGDGTTTSRVAPTLVLSGVNAVESVTTGDFHSCAVTVHGLVRQLYCWGANYVGQIGDGTTTGRPSPAPIATSIWQVAAGGNHTMSTHF